MMTAVARPPGVYFDVVEPKVQQPRRRSDVAGFVGFAASATDPFRCDRFTDFTDCCPKPNPDGYLVDAVRGFFANGGRTCWVAAASDGDVGGRKCGLESALGRLAGIDQVSLLVVPDSVMLEGAKGHRGEANIWQAMMAQAEDLRDRVALLDPPRDWIPQPDAAAPALSPTGLAALYWPWIEVADQRPDASRRGSAARAVPPCGHVAGTIARRDLSRGVFASPANIVIEGALGVTHELSAVDRANVNELGVNVIVAAPGRGVRAMGARTLLAAPARDDDRARIPTSALVDPYRWLNVRRLVAHLAEWIAEDTQWSVFEPQGEVLYRAIERSVRTILFDLWRRGGLVGDTDDEAYLVRCDATTNPPDEAEQGRVVCLVGLRPAVPAEMIVVRIGIAEGRVELLGREFADA